MAVDFDLEPDPDPGQLPQRVITELRAAYSTAKDYAKGYGDAAKAQAEKYKIKPAALKRYIAALEGDKVDEAEREAEDLQRLIEGAAE